MRKLTFYDHFKFDAHSIAFLLVLNQNQNIYTCCLSRPGQIQGKPFTVLGWMAYMPV